VAHARQHVLLKKGIAVWGLWCEGPVHSRFLVPGSLRALRPSEICMIRRSGAVVSRILYAIQQ